MEIDEIEKIIDYTFINKNLLIRALTRKSFADEQNVKNSKSEHQEVFSTLGDAMLKAILIEELIKSDFTTKGDITIKKSKIENKEHLSIIASKMGIKDFILMSKGERIQKTNKNPKILETTLEAIVAAIYYDGGYNEAKNTVLKWLKRYQSNNH